MEKLVTYWFTIVDGKGSGPAGDGTYVIKFGGRGAEQRCREFAAQNTHYGRPAEAMSQTTSTKVYARWQREGSLR